MFYWFYRTTHPDGHLNRPIVLWLQGGPGLSGAGVGNFLMLGPVDEKLKPRNATWIQSVSLLFVDYPGDTGFSVVSSPPTTIEDISSDLINMLQGFFSNHTEYKHSPLYIFGQSHGGKVAPALAYYLNKYIQAGLVECNLTGVAMGNAYISSTDIMVSWAPVLYYNSLIDDVQYERMEQTAWLAYQAGEKKRWITVEELQQEMFDQVFGALPGFEVYDYIHPHNIPAALADIERFMNGPVRQKLGIIPEHKRWLGRSLGARAALTDIHQPVWDLVDELLKHSHLDVVVYQGQLDFICSTPGALRWIDRSARLVGCYDNTVQMFRCLRTTARP